MTHTAMINPFYAARLNPAATPAEERDQPVYDRLPRAPKNANPVPHLSIPLQDRPRKPGCSNYFVAGTSRDHPSHKIFMMNSTRCGIKSRSKLQQPSFVLKSARSHRDPFLSHLGQDRNLPLARG
jgi:hypothetical protein